MRSKIVSADSHVVEPPDLWTSRLGAEYEGRAPRLTEDAEGAKFEVNGVSGPAVVGGFISPAKAGLGFATRLSEGLSGGWDPAARIVDMDKDGIAAEVLYPSFAMRLFGLEDPVMQRDTFRAYNDWVAEYAATNPKRLYGLGLISLYDVEAGVEELERCAAMGLSGGMSWAEPQDGYSYGTDHYDRFWAAAQDLGMPISLHTFAGRARDVSDLFLARYSCITHVIQLSLTTLLFSHVFERFPGVTVVSAENDIGWAPHLMERMDHAYIRKGSRHAPPFPSGMLPSEQFKRNVRATFMQDRAGVNLTELVGSDVFMWASDYPHDDSTWPESVDVIDRLFDGVADAHREKITHSNAVASYRMDLPA